MPGAICTIGSCVPPLRTTFLVADPEAFLVRTLCRPGLDFLADPVPGVALAAEEVESGLWVWSAVPEAEDGACD